MNIKVMCLLPLYSTVADRVGLRTVDACEPRQVRKEAAAAGYARVAVLSGSVSSFFVTIQPTCFLSDSYIRSAHVQYTRLWLLLRPTSSIHGVVCASFFLSNKYQARWMVTMACWSTLYFLFCLFSWRYGLI